MSWKSYRFGIQLLGGLLVMSFMSLLTGCNTELARARKLAGNKDYQTAILYYEKALKVDSENVEALKEASAIYCDHLKLMSQCYEKSSILYKRFPKDPVITGWYKKSLWIFARNLYIQQLLSKSSKYLHRYLKIDKSNGKVFYMLADAKFRLNRKPPRKDDVLKEAIAEFHNAIKNTKATDTVRSTFNSKKKNILQWEAYMKIGTIYDMWIKDKFLAWRKELAKKAKEKAQKAAKEAKKSRRRRRRRRRRRNAEKKKPPKFPVNEEHFANAIKAYKAASKIGQPNKYKRALPYIQIALFYAQFKGQNLEAVKWLKKAEQEDDTNLNVAGNLKMIYDRLKEEAENNKEKRLAKKYDKLSVQYDSKVASLRGQK